MLQDGFRSWACHLIAYGIYIRPSRYDAKSRYAGISDRASEFSKKAGDSWGFAQVLVSGVETQPAAVGGVSVVPSAPCASVHQAVKSPATRQNGREFTVGLS